MHVAGACEQCKSSRVSVIINGPAESKTVCDGFFRFFFLAKLQFFFCFSSFLVCCSNWLSFTIRSVCRRYLWGSCIRQYVYVVRWRRRCCCGRRNIDWNTREKKVDGSCLCGTRPVCCTTWYWMDRRTCSRCDNNSLLHHYVVHEHKHTHLHTNTQRTSIVGLSNRIQLVICWAVACESELIFCFYWNFFSLSCTKIVSSFSCGKMAEHTHLRRTALPRVQPNWRTYNAFNGIKWHANAFDFCVFSPCSR